jgi:methylenetetrahydrofolate reductase (NADPH)
VQNFKQTANFARRAGTSVLRRLAERFDGLEDDPATRRLVAAAVCAEQVIDLIDHGVEDLHFYTMNLSTSTATFLPRRSYRSTCAAP